MRVRHSRKPVNLLHARPTFSLTWSPSYDHLCTGVPRRLRRRAIRTIRIGTEVLIRKTVSRCSSQMTNFIRHLPPPRDNDLLFGDIGRHLTTSLWESTSRIPPLFPLPRFFACSFARSFARSQRCVSRWQKNAHGR